MKCEELVELMVEYYDDALDAPLRAQLEHHCDLCPDCLNFLNTYGATIALTEQAYTQALPADVQEALRREIRAGLAAG